MIEIIALSLIQGITEFLPISSSSHLIILSQYLEFNNAYGHGSSGGPNPNQGRKGIPYAAGMN